MKLYVMSGTTNGIKDIDGVYYLIAETGECLASHFCSCKYFAKGDLYERRPERIKEFTKRFGDIEVLYLGEDDMTVQKLMDLNKKWAIENGLYEEEIMKNEEIIDYLMSTGLYGNTDVDMFYEKKMLDENKTVPIRDLIERFVGVDKEFHGEPWNIRQILTNIDMIIPVEDRN